MTTSAPLKPPVQAHTKLKEKSSLSLDKSRFKYYNSMFTSLRICLKLIRNLSRGYYFTPLQFILLYEVGQGRDSSQKLANTTYLSVESVNQLLWKLEDKGMVRLVSRSSKSAQLRVQFTDDGQFLMDQIPHYMTRAMGKCMDRLTEPSPPRHAEELRLAAKCSQKHLKVIAFHLKKRRI